MTRVYLLVEGQTEETFVREVLIQPFAGRGIYLTPILVSTSRGHRGGLVSYAKVKPQIEKLCKQDAAAYVSTMFDLYALPVDFPGRDSPDYPSRARGAAKAAFLEARLIGNIGFPNFLANLLVHEFEALLFANVEAFSSWTSGAKSLSQLKEATRLSAPEDIDEGPRTAPSKRVLSAIPGYQKPVHGSLIAQSIGLDAIRAACPHFNAWITKLEAL